MTGFVAPPVVLDGVWLRPGLAQTEKHVLGHIMKNAATGISVDVKPFKTDGGLIHKKQRISRQFARAVRKQEIKDNGPENLRPVGWHRSRAALSCPVCAWVNTLFEVGGGTIEPQLAGMSKSLASPTGAPALTNGGYTFMTSCEICICGHCASVCYTVNLDEVNNPAVSPKWAFEHIWLNKGNQRGRLYSVEVHENDFSHRWIVERVETAVGVFQRHTFGPFAELNVREKCASIGRIWPFIVSGSLAPQGRKSVSGLNPRNLKVGLDQRVDGKSGSVQKAS